MNKTLLSGLLLLTVGIVFTSCKKDSNSNSSNTFTAPTSPTPTVSDGGGACVAIKAVTQLELPGLGTYETVIGTAAAVFYDSPGTFLDAGTVSVDANALAKQSNNGYVYTPSQTNPLGLTFSGSNLTWSVGGSGSVSAFTKSVSGSFPDVGSLVGDTVVTRSSGYTLASTSSYFNADSVYFTISSSAKTLSKSFVGTVTSCTFTAAELADFSAGTGAVQITPYKIVDNITVSGRKTYFINESALTRLVNIK
jgi:hypothetical protein